MISLSQIKKLRYKTSAGIMDCRQALTASLGDEKKALLWIKKKGLETAAKKKGRVTATGLVEAYIHCNGLVGSLVKISCETDFVAKTKEFKDLAHEIALQVAALNPQDIRTLLAQVYIRDPQKTIKDLVNEVIAKTGENIKIESFSFLSFGK